MVGSGHVMRCKTLADELRRRDAEVLFVCREDPGHLIALLRGNGYQVCTLPQQDERGEELQKTDAQQTLAALGAFQPDWLVVDHYGLDAEWEQRLRPQVGHMLAIDDLANRPHVCDVLLDQNEFGEATQHRYDARVPADCQRLLGPRHALLQPLFAPLRASLPPRDGAIRRVLLFFGGVDSHGQTLKALQAFDAPVLRELALDVVVGHANPLALEIMHVASTLPCATIHTPLPTLAGLMARADLMLSAGGSVTWERCCLALPGIVTTAAANQQGFTTMLAGKGVHVDIGEAAQVGVETWRQAILALLQDTEQVRNLSQRAATVCDGLGTKRVAAVLDGGPMTLRMRHAMQSDELLLLEWANDPDVRRNAFNVDPIAPEAHHAWFLQKLANPASVILIGEDAQGLPVGQVRFDVQNNEAIIDVSVDRLFRGRGVGERLLRLALDTYFEMGHAAMPVAEVKRENQASCRLFQQVGFQLSSSPSRGADSYRFVLPR